MVYDDNFSLPPDSPQANIALYVAGYVCQHYLKSHKCADCKSSMFGNPNEHVSAATNLIRMKAYNTINSVHGNLCTPSIAFLKFIEFADNVFMNNFPNIIHMNRITQILCSAIVDKADFSFVPASCTKNINLNIIIFCSFTKEILAESHM